ncbi:MAG: hypothetical protein MUF45_08205 [Spirosomaceae bacterium]|nr:hypothetical protein [Spirosomataceae bacterium]
MPLVIGGVTLASKKWGNLIGGMIASLPWIAGPIILFFTLEQGIDFTINSVKGIMIGTIGVLGFCFAYIYSCISQKWYVSLLLAYLAFAITSMILNAIGHFIGLTVWYLLTIFLIVLSLVIFPKLEKQKSHSQPLKYDIYLRMIIATLFVVFITYLADTLGPTWSGILTPFPIMTAILSAFTHYTQGPHSTSIIMRGMLSGFAGFASFLYIQALLLPHFSIPIAFLIGLIVNVIINLMMRYFVTKIISN